MFFFQWGTPAECGYEPHAADIKKPKKSAPVVVSSIVANDGPLAAVAASSTGDAYASGFMRDALASSWIGPWQGGGNQEGTAQNFLI